METTNYATIDEIRMKAGFEKAVNLPDRFVKQARFMAQSEINAALATRFAVPFVPVPDVIHALTVDLAAALLSYEQFGDMKSKTKLEAARDRLRGLAEGEESVIGPDGESLSDVHAVRGYPDASAPRMFSVDQRF